MVARKSRLCHWIVCTENLHLLKVTLCDFLKLAQIVIPGGREVRNYFNILPSRGQGVWALLLIVETVFPITASPIVCSAASLVKCVSLEPEERARKE